MDKILKYYAFDWDDNILHMPTSIHMFYKGEPRDILPGEFSQIRNNLGKDWSFNDDSFKEFEDGGPRGVDGFISDIDSALSNKKYGPSFYHLIKALVDSSIIMVVTARGHEPETLRLGIKYIVDNYLPTHLKNRMFSNILELYKKTKTDEPLHKSLFDWYLDQCMFMGVFSNTFQETFQVTFEKNCSEVGKEMILAHFISRINEKNEKLGYKFTVGMSDDDTVNVKHIKKFFSQSHWSNVVGLYVYDTSNPDHIVKTKY